MLALNIKDSIMPYLGTWLSNILWDEMYIKISLLIAPENVKPKIGPCTRQSVQLQQPAQPMKKRRHTILLIPSLQ